MVVTNMHSQVVKTQLKAQEKAKLPKSNLFNKVEKMKFGTFKIFSLASWKPNKHYYKKKKTPPVCLISIWLTYLRITVLFQRGWHYTNNTAVSPFVFFLGFMVNLWKHKNIGPRKCSTRSSLKSQTASPRNSFMAPSVRNVCFLFIEIIIFESLVDTDSPWLYRLWFSVII